MARVVEVSPLAERLSEVIDEFCECNEVSCADVLDALEITYGAFERYTDDTPPNKMH